MCNYEFSINSGLGAIDAKTNSNKTINNPTPIPGVLHYVVQRGGACWNCGGSYSGEDMKSRHYFNPKDGNMNMENRTGFKDRVKLLKETRHVLSITEDKETRSEKQNKYMWGVVYKLLAGHTGYTPDEIHQEMGRQFLSYEHQGTKFVKSTTKLNTRDMETYLENVRRFGSAELGCYVPLPNESDLPYDIK